MNKIILSLAALAFSAAAHASITPVLTGTPVAAGDRFAYNYSATLASDQALTVGSYFTLYDFVGFAGFGMVPMNWTGTTALLGRTPSQTLPNDDATILNITFTYSGPDFNFNSTSQQELGNFVVFGSGDAVRFDDYTSEALLNNGPTIGTPVQTIGQNAVGVSDGGGGDPNPAVPEPATWATMLVGLGLVGSVMRRRGKRTVAA